MASLRAAETADLQEPEHGQGEPGLGVSARPDRNPYHAEWQLLLDAIRGDKPHNEARRAGEAEVAALMGRIADPHRPDWSPGTRS